MPRLRLRLNNGIFLSLLALGLAFGFVACSDDEGVGPEQEKKADGGERIYVSDDDLTISPSGDGDSVDTGGASSVGTNGSGGAGGYMLPTGYTPADEGGYDTDPDEIGADEDLEDRSGPDEEEGCGSQIIGVVRDFKRGDWEGGHPDFQTYTGNGEKGILEDRLGDGKKPILASGNHQFITNSRSFESWYVTTEDVNRAYIVSFSFEPNGQVMTFHSSNFFPLDGLGFGNQEHNHNYAFTTEVHTEFEYKGGETFSFVGDDDLWVFINGRLAIDLGGLHPAQSDSVDLDTAAGDLGIEIGGIYSLDLFHAERHTVDSNFRIDTNLSFTNCGIFVPDEPPIR